MTWTQVGVFLLQAGLCFTGAYAACIVGTRLLVRRGVRPLYALSISAGLFFALITWRAEQVGLGARAWAACLPTAIGAAVWLRGWADRVAERVARRKAERGADAES